MPARRKRDADGLMPQHPRVFVEGKRKGFRSSAVICWPDGTMTRGDTDLRICTLIPNLTIAGKIVGMTREEFIAARDAAREEAASTP